MERSMDTFRISDTRSRTMRIQRARGLQSESWSTATFATNPKRALGVQTANAAHAAKTCVLPPTATLSSCTAVTHVESETSLTMEMVHSIAMNAQAIAALSAAQAAAHSIRAGSRRSFAVVAALVGRMVFGRTAPTSAARNAAESIALPKIAISRNGTVATKIASEACRSIHAPTTCAEAAALTATFYALNTNLENASSRKDAKERSKTNAPMSCAVSIASNVTKRVRSMGRNDSAAARRRYRYLQTCG